MAERVVWTGKEYVRKRPMTWFDTLCRTLFPDRCHQWRLGPFSTDWRCLKPKKHDGDHVYEPDCWIAGSTFENTWRLGEKVRAEMPRIDGRDDARPMGISSPSTCFSQRGSASIIV